MKAIITKANGHDSILMISKNNPKQASIMLTSTAFSSNEQGFVQRSKRVGLIKGETEILEELIKMNGLKEGDDWSAKVSPVKLIVKETFEPQYDGQEEKLYPKGHVKEGQPVTSEGLSVYRQTYVVAEGLDVHDELLPTDREEVSSEASAVEEAREAFKTSK